MFRSFRGRASVRAGVGTLSVTMAVVAGLSAGVAEAIPTGNSLIQEITREVQVTGINGVPLDAAAVALNVTAVDSAGDGYATVYPCGQPRPNASNLNFAKSDIVPNAVVVRPGAGGKVCVVASSDADLLVDVSGWFSATSGATWLAAPSRVLSTRDGIGSPVARVGTGAVFTLAFPQVPVGATSAVLNVTVTNTSGPGYLTVFPCGTPPPNASNLNFVAGDTVANLAIVRPGTGNAVCFYASAATDVIADLTGWLAGGYSPLPQPSRVLSTRDGIGAPKARVTKGATLALTAAPPAGAAAAVMNVTVTNTSGPGYLTVRPCGAAASETSTLNFTAGDTVANLAIVGAGAGNAICFVAGAADTDVIADLSGWLTTGYTALAAPVRVLDTRQCPFMIYGQDVTPVPQTSSVISDFVYIARNQVTGAEKQIARTLVTRLPGTSTSYSKPFLSRDCYAYAMATSFDARYATYPQSRALVRIDLRSGQQSLITNFDTYPSVEVIGEGPGDALVVSTSYPYSGAEIQRISRNTFEYRGYSYVQSSSGVATDATGTHLYYLARGADDRPGGAHLEDMTMSGDPVPFFDPAATQPAPARIVARGFDGLTTMVGTSPNGASVLLQSAGMLTTVNLTSGERRDIPAPDPAIAGWTRDNRVAYVSPTDPASVVAVNPDGSTSVVLTATTPAAIGVFVL